MMIEANNLTKRFAKFLPPALDDVSFHVNKGDIFGLLGHNGAGKSTALGIMLGMVHANSGEVMIDGISVQHNHRKALAKVGAIFESPSFYDYMSGWDNLTYLTGLSGYKDRVKMEEVVELVNLTDRIRSKVATYSHGMRQRLGLAQALLPQPEVLLLDEPTDGLDPEGIKELRDLIGKLRDEMGITILFNSHLLSEVEQVCSHFAILKQGKVVFQGNQEDFNAGENRILLDVDDWEKASAVVMDLGGRWTNSGAFLPVDLDIAILVEKLVSAGIRVRAVEPRKLSLEELYFRHTGTT